MPTKRISYHYTVNVNTENTDNTFQLLVCGKVLVWLDIAVSQTSSGLDCLVFCSDVDLKTLTFSAVERSQQLESNTLFLLKALYVFILAD